MNNPGRLSSLRGLRTFCVAARYKSFRIAAETLAVTPSAVSHQIKALEDELNTPLFVRTGRSLELTPTAENLFNELDPLMQQLAGVMGRFQAPRTHRQLRVSVQPFFASEMFVPRLDEFSSKQTDLEIYVDTSDESAESHPPNMDASIRLYRNIPANLKADRLFPLKLIPACSPGFLAQFKNHDSKLKQQFPLIHHSSRPHAWSDWQKATGIKLCEPSGMLAVDSMIAVARAAERGVGAALVPMPLSENWFRYGALVPLFEEPVIMPDQFYFVTDKSQSSSPDVAALRSWVITSFSDLA